MDEISLSDRTSELRCRLTKAREDICACSISMAVPIASIAALAEEIFGEQRVSYQSGADNIIIHFPEIEITNKYKYTHIIRDLYMKLTIQNEDNRRMVYIEGTRSTLTIEEFDTQYSHSHLDSDSHLGEFSEFCIGTGRFFDVTQLVREYATSTIDNWYLYLYSLPSYLSWESLDGGPYMKIGNIRSHENSSEAMSADIVNKVCHHLSTDYLFFHEGTIQLNHQHPGFIALCDKYYQSVSSVQQQAGDRQLRYEEDYCSFAFRGKPVQPKIFIPSTAPRHERMPLAIIEHARTRITDILQSFNAQLTHDTNQSIYKTRLGSIPILQPAQVSYF